MILLFMHGWGFDGGFWAPLADLLPEWRAAFDDRGYFGAPHVPEPDDDCIVIAHSFGTMRALAAPPQHCRGLVAINGFDRFTAGPDGTGVSPRIVDRMIARFGEDPAGVLTDFRRRCGDDAPFGPANIERLQEDLLALRDLDCTAQSAQWQLPILSLQGAQDPLLPAGMRDDVFSSAPILERLTHPTGGHLLPATDAPYCARVIRSFMEHAA